MKPAYISDLAVYLPKRLVSNHELESQIKVCGKPMRNGILENLFGSRERYFADKNTQVSDLAANAGQLIVKRTNRKIDLLIFAAASSDLIEPATSNIVQQKIGLTCPVMDVKNACNSVTTAIQTATAFVSSGMYNNVLIVNGEKLSEVINFNPRDNEHLMNCFAGYSLGDAGAAILISDKGGSPIHFQRAISWGEHWGLCTVKGGGSQSFRNAESYYFEGKTTEMRKVFTKKALPYIKSALDQSEWKMEDVDCLITHQVSKATVEYIANTLDVPLEKCINVFDLYGNTAAASIPLAMNYAVKNNKLSKGDKLMLIGLAAGISVSVQLITW
jgi:3-oxoacyl-(acyl-carrier-protein) synthase III